MLCKSCFVVLLFGLLMYMPVTANAQFGNSTIDDEPVSITGYQQLTGRWVVTAVEKNGELTAAEIGQQPGDVITIKEGDDFPRIT